MGLKGKVVETTSLRVPHPAKPMLRISKTPSLYMGNWWFSFRRPFKAIPKRVPSKKTEAHRFMEDSKL